MIEAIKQFVISADFVFAIIIIGFIVVVALLLLENRRDNQKLVQLNQKVKDLIAGDYSEVLDMQGSPEITDMTNSINDLSEVIRLTHENLEQETKTPFQYPVLYDRWRACDQPPGTDYYYQRYGNQAVGS